VRPAASFGHREAVVNVHLADALSAKGLGAEAEVVAAKGRSDVLVSLSGVKLVIEGRHHGQSASLRADAKARIRKGIGEISLAVAYADVLYEEAAATLPRTLEAARFDGSIFYFASSSIQEKPFSDASLEALSALIRNAFALIVRDDAVRYQVAAVETAIDEAVRLAAAANLFFTSKQVRENLKAALAIDLPEKTQDHGEEEA
jgi:hypothetical protein